MWYKAAFLFGKAAVKFGFIGVLGFCFSGGEGGEAPFTPAIEETQQPDKPKFEG